MKKIVAILLCLSLGASLCACKKSGEENAPRKEESAGTGYGTGRSSAIIEQDLYFLRPGSKRAEVESALGSPQSFVVTDADSCTYRLADGETLVLTYTKADKVDTAEYTDAEGKKWDFFAFLNSKGIIVNYGSSTPLEETPEQTPVEDTPGVELPETGMPSDVYYYFSIQRYSYEMADQILEEGALRETVISALGKPNAYSSVDFKAHGYIIDVYHMDDGSSLYLDYGYAREKLRAVRKVKSGVNTDLLGKWGAEEQPDGLYRGDRTRYLFNSLAAGQKPSEVYRRYGEPDWYEGNSRNYKDAYCLQDGSVLYLDFGSGHSTLTAASIKKADGGIVVVELR